MSKQTPQNVALRSIGLSTKNANFDSTCKCCGEPIRGKAPKDPVVAVGNRFGGSRKQVWIHTTCVDVNIDTIPDTGRTIATQLSASQLTLFEGDDKKTPPKETPPKETPPKKIPKESPPTPKKETPKPSYSVGEKTAEGGVLAGLIAPHLIDMVSDHVDSSIQSGLSQLAIPRPLVVKPLGEADEVEVGLAHPAFDHLLQMGQIRSNSLAVGPAGSGKTFAAKQVFDTLQALPSEVGGFVSDKVRFTVVSCHNEMMPSDIVGPMIPNISDGSENHRITEAVKTYRDGGVLVFDEFDRLMGGTAVAANMALANETWTMPDGTVVHRSPDLYILCTANTLGQGKGRGPYSAAEVLDGATLNRFAGGIIHWDYDEAFERQLISDDEITNFFHEVRRKAKDANLVGRIISPRHMQTAWKQKHILKWSMERIRQISLADWTEKDLRTIGYDAKFIEGTTSFGGAC
jgi:hypothetical protein